MTTSKLFSVFRTTFRGSISLNRGYVVKRRYPIDRSLEDALPVEEYTVKDRDSNVVYVWGLAEHGALGALLMKKQTRTRPHKLFHRPLRLTFGEINNVVNVAAGYGFTAFAVRDGNQLKVFGTGVNTDSQIGVHEPRKGYPLEIILVPALIDLPIRNKKSKVINMSAGRSHLVINTTEGLFTLGNNSYGQCARRIISDEQYTGSQTIHHLSNIDGEQVLDIECGQDHTLFLTESGRVYSCGWGADGQTGQGHFNTTGVPSLVVGDIQGERIVKLSSKADCVLALSDKGEVFGWGNTEYSQLVSENDQRQQICTSMYLSKCKHVGTVKDIAAAGSYCILLNDAGEVYTWGYGLLGRGPAASQCWQPELIPQVLFGRNQFQSNSTVTSITCGMDYSCAINNFGDVYMWGKNKGGCLGLGHSNDQYFPLKVAVGHITKKVFCGVDHTVAICQPY